MELEKYDLTPQEKVAVSLYLKTMNKSQASRDAGYASPSVFNKPPVKAAIADLLTVRAERLRIGSDWVLQQLVRVYNRCMKVQHICDIYGQPTGETKFDANGSLKALALIGKHVDVQAWDNKQSESSVNEDVVNRLKRGRERLEISHAAEQGQVQQISNEDIANRLKRGRERLEISPAVEAESPPVSFIDPPDPLPLTESQKPVEVEVVEAEPEAFMSEDEKLELLMERWRGGYRGYRS